MSMYNDSLRAFLKPVLGYLDDPRVSEVMINGPDEVWIESAGKLQKVNASFTADGLLAAARNMAQFVGRPLNEERPRLDARLPDGSRIHVVLPPVSRKGVAIAIRKFFPAGANMDKLIGFGAITEEAAEFLRACVQSHLNMVIAGGTSSGKTTLLNVLSQYIPNEERILTIEDSAELQLQQEHLVPFESRPADERGKGAVSIADLLHSSLRLRPDRIIIGEVRGPEAFDLIQAMNTGHSGCMCTTHANTPTETLRRLESLCLMSEVDMPMVAVRSLLAAAVHVVVCASRQQDGSRKITHISEVLPLSDKGDYRTADIFRFHMAGRAKSGKVLGTLSPTGYLPGFLDKIRALGLGDFPNSFFGAAANAVPGYLEPPAPPAPVVPVAAPAQSAGAPRPASSAAARPIRLEPDETAALSPPHRPPTSSRPAVGESRPASQARPLSHAEPSPARPATAGKSAARPPAHDERPPFDAEDAWTPPGESTNADKPASKALSLRERIMAREKELLHEAMAQARPEPPADDEDQPGDPPRLDTRIIQKLEKDRESPESRAALAQLMADIDRMELDEDEVEELEELDPDQISMVLKKSGGTGKSPAPARPASARRELTEEEIERLVMEEIEGKPAPKSPAPAAEEDYETLDEDDLLDMNTGRRRR
ncbi:MAG: hypothetical protein GMKNLPBB_02345 [Myxococcota bacterium]|nr:hypothetical protein [Myxococcota bacterium]